MVRLPATLIAAVLLAGGVRGAPGDRMVAQPRTGDRMAAHAGSRRAAAQSTATTFAATANAPAGGGYAPRSTEQPAPAVPMPTFLDPNATPGGGGGGGGSGALGEQPPPAVPPPPASPPPSPAPVTCAPAAEGDVALSAYPSGTMLMFKYGNWGTVCRHYTQDTLDSAHVLCRQLGYEMALEQHVTDEDMSAIPINLWAIQCRPVEGFPPAARRALASASSSASHSSASALGADVRATAGRQLRGSSGGAATGPGVVIVFDNTPAVSDGRLRLLDCHSKTCKHIHCGCSHLDALAVTCGGAYAPDFPQCGSAGALPPTAAAKPELAVQEREARAHLHSRDDSSVPADDHNSHSARASAAALLVTASVLVVGAALLSAAWSGRQSRAWRQRAPAAEGSRPAHPLL